MEVQPQKPLQAKKPLNFFSLMVLGILICSLLMLKQRLAPIWSLYSPACSRKSWAHLAERYFVFALGCFSVILSELLFSLLVFFLVLVVALCSLGVSSLSNKILFAIWKINYSQEGKKKNFSGFEKDVRKFSQRLHLYQRSFAKKRRKEKKR